MRQAGEGWVPLVVATAEFVDDEIEGRYDVEAESAGSCFEIGVSWGTDDMAVGVVFEHEAVGSVGIEGERFVAEGDVVGGNELLVFPTAIPEEAIGEAEGVGGMDGDAAGAVSVVHEGLAAVEAKAPRAPAHGSGESGLDKVWELHAGDISEDHGGDVGGRGGIGVSRSGFGPEGDFEAGGVDVTEVLAWNRLERNHFASDDSWGSAFAVVPGGHAQELAQGDLGFARVIQGEGLGEEGGRVDLLVEAVGEEVLFFIEENAAGDAGVSLAGGGHVGVRVSAGLAEVFFKNEVAVADHEETSVGGGGALHARVGSVEAFEVHAGELADGIGVAEGAPAAFGVGGGEIVGSGGGGGGERAERGGEQGEEGFHEAAKIGDGVYRVCGMLQERRPA
ncbi:MAG: hypothetical protein RLZZ399_2700 [Verrucomicrobiota bacterium]